MSEWISSNYKVSSQDVKTSIPKDTVPLYLIDRLENNERITYVGCYGLKKQLDFIKLDTTVINVPLKLNPDRSNYETFLKMCVKDSNRFSIQFHRYGHSRPMIFFEVDDEFSACFIHIGGHNVRLNGYYESSKVLAETERIYGLIQIESGIYSIKKSKNNRLYP